MKREQYTVSDQELGQRRLDHYNAWLMDNTREFGVPYPGYPEDKETVQKDTVFTEKVEKVSKVGYNKLIETKGKTMSTKVTNLSKATEIVRTGTDQRLTKAEILSTIMTELGVTKSNAFVYFTKASKALGFTVTVDKGAVADKVAKVAKTKGNPVTGTSVAKATAKVAEIDKVINELKSKGAASPFGALMTN